MGMDALSFAAGRLDEMLHMPFGEFAAVALDPREGSLRAFLASLSSAPRESDGEEAAAGARGLLDDVRARALLILCRLVAGEHEALGKDAAWRAVLRLTGDIPSREAVARAWSQLLYDRWAVDAPLLLDLAAAFSSPATAAVVSPLADRKRQTAPASLLMRGFLACAVTVLPALRADVGAMQDTIAQCLDQAGAQYSAAPPGPAGADARLSTIRYIADVTATVARAVGALPALADDLLVPKEDEGSAGGSAPAPLLPALRALAQTTLIRAAADAARDGSSEAAGVVAACVEAVVSAVHVAAVWAALEPLGVPARPAGSPAGAPGVSDPAPRWPYTPPCGPGDLAAMASGAGAPAGEGDAAAGWVRRSPRAAGRALLWLVGTLRVTDGNPAPTPEGASRGGFGQESARLLLLWSGRCGLREALSSALADDTVPSAARSSVRDALSLLPSRGGDALSAPSLLRRSSSGGASTASGRSGASAAARKASSMGMTPALRARTLQLARLQAFDEYNDEVDDSLADGTGGAVEAAGATHEDERESGGHHGGDRAGRGSGSSRGATRGGGDGGGAAAAASAGGPSGGRRSGGSGSGGGGSGSGSGSSSSRGRGSHGRGGAGPATTGDSGSVSSGGRGRGRGRGRGAGSSQHAGKHDRRKKALQKQGGRV